jgi:hypothetical protein
LQVLMRSLESALALAESPHKANFMLVVRLLCAVAAVLLVDPPGVMAVLQSPELAMPHSLGLLLALFPRYINRFPLDRTFDMRMFVLALSAFLDSTKTIALPLAGLQSPIVASIFLASRLQQAEQAQVELEQGNGSDDDFDFSHELCIDSDPSPGLEPLLEDEYLSVFTQTLNSLNLCQPQAIAQLYDVMGQPMSDLVRGYISLGT